MSTARFADSYYIFNTLLVLAFVPLRLYFRIMTPDGSDHGTLHSLHELANWEKQALTSFCVILAWQAVRRRSWDHYAQQVFFYGKLITASTMYMVDRRLMVWYLLLCWVAIAVCPQPMFPLHGTSPESQWVVGLDPLKMKDHVLTTGDTAWLVYFYSEQHSNSIAMAPAFHDLATQHVGPKLRFGCMDATLWPQYCKDTLKVVPNTWLAHLPTTVLYSRGKEVDRLPRLEDIDEIGLKRNYYTKADVTKKLLNKARG